MTIDRIAIFVVALGLVFAAVTNHNQGRTIETLQSRSAEDLKTHDELRQLVKGLHDRQGQMIDNSAVMQELIKANTAGIEAVGRRQ